MIFRIVFTLLVLLIVAGGYFFGGDGRLSGAIPSAPQPQQVTPAPAEAATPNPYAGLKAN